MYVNHTTPIDFLLKRFEVTDLSDFSASVLVDLRPVKQGDTVVDRP